MAVLIDPPTTAGHGRLWSHLASDSSFEELHEFARHLGVPARGFDRDHYDIPEELHPRAVDAGAVPVTSRELIARLYAAGLRRPKAFTFAPRRPGRVLLRPPRLGAGDRIAVVSPAGPVDAGRLAAGVEVLRSWGLQVQEQAGDGGELPWLAGSDVRRAEQLTGAWTDAEVRAVWAARGGYGTQRLLEHLDWDVLGSSTPRLLVGFSDLTALHQAFAVRLGVATVHAPGVAALAATEPAALDVLREVVMTARGVELTGRQVQRGRAEGVLVGGNLTVLATSAGTPLVRPAAGGIAVLEDVGEQPYRLDRSLTQLLRSGWFHAVQGIALGSFSSCGDPALVRALLEERLTPLGVPVVADLPVGHVPDNQPVPLGVRGELDADQGTLRVGPAVR